VNHMLYWLVRTVFEHDPLRRAALQLDILPMTAREIVLEGTYFKRVEHFLGIMFEEPLTWWD
jgi:hypothetical protein